MLFSQVPAGAADAGAVIDAWIKSQSACRTWTAEFTQTRTLKALSRPLTASGRVWFSAPDRFRWEVTQPSPTIAVRDRDKMLVIYPRLKRAERYPLAQGASGPIGEALALFDAGFPKDRSKFEERFKVLSVAPSGPNWEVSLQPARPMARRLVPEIRVFLATNDYSLVGNEIAFADGSRLRNDFKNPSMNAAIPESTFAPHLGDDVQVTEPLAK